LGWGETGPQLMPQQSESLRSLGTASRRRCFAPSDMTIGKRFWSRMWRSFDQTTCALHLWYEMWRRAGQDKNKRYMPECLYERRKRTYLRNSQADAVLRSR